MDEQTKQILAGGIIAILRLERAGDLLPMAEAIRAGAAFVAAPNMDPEVLQACRAAGIPAIPGAFTPTEILQAWKLGASLVKVFPAGPAGAGYVGESSA